MNIFGQKEKKMFKSIGGKKSSNQGERIRKPSNQGILLVKKRRKPSNQGGKRRKASIQEKCLGKREENLQIEGKS